MTYYVNNEEVQMTAGDIIYIPTGSLRQRDSGTVENNYISINFHSPDKLKFEPLLKNCINEEIKALLEFFDMIYAHPLNINYQKLFFVLEAIILQISDNMSFSSMSQLTAKIVDYISTHFREKISLEDICQFTYFSPAYCANEFRKTMGKSIIHYLIDFRIAEAKKLLSGTSFSCATISNMVGFDDSNYFSRIFKKRTGLSPLKYRSLSN
jgi:YesN/AraC family two-component response regulator